MSEGLGELGQSHHFRFPPCPSLSGDEDAERTGEGDCLQRPCRFRNASRDLRRADGSCSELSEEGI